LPGVQNVVLDKVAIGWNMQFWKF